MPQTGTAGSRRPDRGGERPVGDRGLLPEPGSSLPPAVVAFDPEEEIAVRDNRPPNHAATWAATRAAVADDFAARFGLEDVESSADALADRYGFRYEEPVAGEASRRTVTITGRGADRVIAPGREVRRAPRRRPEPVGFRGDRIALWAVGLGLLLAFVAAVSAHAAVLPAAAGLH